MVVWESLIVALAFGMTGANAGLCPHASSLSKTVTTTNSNAVPSSVVSAPRVDTSNFHPSPIVPSATQTTLTLKKPSTATTEKNSVTTIHRRTNTASTRKTTTTFTSKAKPKPTPINFLRNPGFDDPSGISFSQPWVLKPSQGKSIAKFRDNYRFKSGSTVLYMSAFGDDAPSIEQWVAGLERTKRYTLSAWVAYESGTGDCHLDLKLGKTLVKRHAISKGSRGRYHKVQGVATSKFQMDSVNMWLYCPSKETVAVLVDDFSLVEVME